MNVFTMTSALIFLWKCVTVNLNWVAPTYGGCDVRKFWLEVTLRPSNILTYSIYSLNGRNIAIYLLFLQKILFYWIWRVVEIDFNDASLSRTLSVRCMRVPKTENYLFFLVEYCCARNFFSLFFQLMLSTSCSIWSLY